MFKYTEETFKEAVQKLRGDKYKIVGRFKGITKPLLVEDKYGLLSLPTASYLLVKHSEGPGILSALNKTEYFMNQLKEVYSEIAEELTPMSEYVAAKKPMLFKNKFGIVSTTPDALIHGHAPGIKAAIDRKEYFKNLLLYLYLDYDYDFEVTSTNRHEGRVTLICPIHGKQSVDTDGIFLGKGCPKCNNHIAKSNTLYIIKLTNDQESFYKLGISYIVNGRVRRYKDYESLGYTVTELITKLFNSFEECIDVETLLKQIIKPVLYQPKIWVNKTSKECFLESVLNILLEKLNQDIVSTSTETLSSQKIDGLNLANSTEENVVRPLSV